MCAQYLGAVLDFLSRDFDPLLALYTPRLQPPNPRALPLDNVHKCRGILPLGDPNYRVIHSNTTNAVLQTAAQPAAAPHVRRAPQQCPCAAPVRQPPDVE